MQVGTLKVQLKNENVFNVTYFTPKQIRMKERLLGLS